MNTVMLNTVHLDGAPIIKKGSGGGGGVTINNQSKSIDIVENGTTEIVADSGYTGLGKVTVNVDVPSSGGDTPTPDMPVIGDGKTYLYIKIAEEGRMTVPLYFSQPVADGVTIDWGDGSATQTVSSVGNVNTTHTYAKVGEYTITLASSCSLGLGYNSSSYCVMGSTENSGRVYCNMLQAVEIGKNVITIHKSAFRFCYSLTSVIISDSVTMINDGAFYYCYSLTNVLIPGSVTYIGQEAFSHCYSLANLVIQEGVTYIDVSAFYYCHSLTSVVIPQSVLTISRTAFSHCYSLTYLVISDSVTRIDDNAFDSCYSLASVVIPQGITTIETRVFGDCCSLASIVISDSVTYIEDGAFNGCFSLTNVVIPDSVKRISDNAFRSCYGMAYYDFSQHTSIPVISSGTFKDLPSDCKIIVPHTLYNEWVKATNWSALANHIIGDYTPTECVSLEITGKDVSGRATSTRVSYTAITNGVNRKGEHITNIPITGDAKSNDFPQNTSTTDTIERTISYTYLGVTATTTITQGVWVDALYTLDLNGGQWAISDTVANPDSETYDGVYQSVLSKGVNDGFDTMYVDIDGYSAFKLYVRSYAEGGYDYVMVSQLDKEITGSTSSSDSTLVKATTQNAPNQDTSINGYTLVEFTGIDKGVHRITIVYRKDSSGNNNDDRGYVLIPKNQ